MSRSIATLPHALYRFFAPDGMLLYVGLTMDPTTRWKNHAKDKPWWCHVANITVEHFGDRVTVLAAERAAIIAEKPVWNVQHNRLHAATSNAIVRATTTPTDPSNQWTFQNRDTNTPRGVGPLVLLWELTGDAVDDYWNIGEISAADLWHQWLVRNPIDEPAEATFGPGARRIEWTLDAAEHCVMEAAPFQPFRKALNAAADAQYRRAAIDAWCEPVADESWESDDPDFLDIYTWPRHAGTGERLQWSRLPVIDKVWRTDNLPSLYTKTGGFIQEATGWKPAPLQPYVNVHDLAAMSGLYSPRALSKEPVR